MLTLPPRIDFDIMLFENLNVEGHLFIKTGSQKISLKEEQILKRQP